MIEGLTRTLLLLLRELANLTFTSISLPLSTLLKLITSDTLATEFISMTLRSEILLTREQSLSSIELTDLKTEEWPSRCPLLSPIESTQSE